MERVEVNVQTGEQKVIQLTDAEVADAQARTASDLMVQQRTAAIRRLQEIDRASIRSIREYIAGKQDVPQLLKDREAEAIAERGKLK